MPTHKDAKAMARTLRVALADRNVSLSHSECLEIVARQFNSADWNTLSAKLLAEERRLARSQGSETASPAAGQARTPSPVTESVPMRPLRSGSICLEMDEARQMARTAAPDQLSCSFCRKSQHDVRSLIEGGCSRPRRGAAESCVFICDECVTFCSQINTDAVGSAVSSPHNVPLGP